jgi:hypothetical protein
LPVRFSIFMPEEMPRTLSASYLKMTHSKRLAFVIALSE